MENQFKCRHQRGEHLAGNLVLKKVKDFGYHASRPDKARRPGFVCWPACAGCY